MKLIVINLRGLQARAAGPYGNRWTETFALDTLAAGGVVFDQHYSVHPGTDLARRAWRTGCYQFPPAREGVVWPDLLDVLHKLGVATRLVLDTSRGDCAEFAAGWQSVESAAGSKTALRRGRELLDGAGGKWLLWLDLASLLPPWRVPEDVVSAFFSEAHAEEDEEEAEEAGQEPLEPLLDPPLGAIDADDDDLYLRMRQTYAAAVSHLDGQLAALLDGLADDVYVIVTADAGLPLGEHGVVGDTPLSLHEEAVHVPLIVYGPGCRPGRRVEALTASVDLAPTIATLAGAKLVGAHGFSLLPLITGDQAELRDYVVCGADGLSLRSSTWARLPPVTAGQPARLYVKPDDLWEVSDVQNQHFERAEGLERTLKAFVEAYSAPGEKKPPELEE